MKHKVKRQRQSEKKGSFLIVAKEIYNSCQEDIITIDKEIRESPRNQLESARRELR